MVHEHNRLCRKTQTNKQARILAGKIIRGYLSSHTDFSAKLSRQKRKSLVELIARNLGLQKMDDGNNNDNREN